MKEKVAVQVDEITEYSDEWFDNLSELQNGILADLDAQTEKLEVFINELEIDLAIGGEEQSTNIDDILVDAELTELDAFEFDELEIDDIFAV